MQASGLSFLRPHESQNNWGEQPYRSQRFYQLRFDVFQWLLFVYPDKSGFDTIPKWYYRLNPLRQECCVEIYIWWLMPLSKCELDGEHGGFLGGAIQGQDDGIHCPEIVGGWKVLDTGFEIGREKLGEVGIVSKNVWVIRPSFGSIAFRPEVAMLSRQICSAKKPWTTGLEDCETAKYQESSLN